MSKIIKYRAEILSLLGLLLMLYQIKLQRDIYKDTKITEKKSISTALIRVFNNKKLLFFIWVILPPVALIIFILQWIYIPKTIDFTDVFAISFNVLWGCGAPIFYIFFKFIDSTR